MLTLRLATVHEDGEPTRRRASRGEFSDEEWELVWSLAAVQPAAGHRDQRGRRDPCRSGPRGDLPALGQTQMDHRGAGIPVLGAARWRRRAAPWEKTADRDKDDALLMGFALTKAQDLAGGAFRGH